LAKGAANAQWDNCGKKKSESSFHDACLFKGRFLTGNFSLCFGLVSGIKGDRERRKNRAYAPADEQRHFFSWSGG
jgi:hypothetical protein